ncbi:MAG: hypothetical protein U0587_15385 [Candidatus Binatia bacterium]
MAGALACCGLLLQLAGCYTSYGAHFIVHPVAIGAASETTPPGTLRDDDIERGKRVAATIAADFKMDPNPQLVGFRAPEDPSEVIAFYFPTKASPDWASDKEGISLWVILSDDRTQLEYLIRDLRSGSETKFARALSQALQEKLEATFGKDRISSRKHSDLMFLAP